MIKQNFKNLNKLEKYGVGPWLDEPDYMSWVDEETNYPCIIRRHRVLGFFCGYVGIGKNHPLYEECFDNVYIRVHGGLTYSEHCQENVEHPICHKTENTEDNLFWFGFDCGHVLDLSPGTEQMLRKINAVRNIGDGFYRDIEYVKKECENLAKQLKDVKSK